MTYQVFQATKTEGGTYESWPEPGDDPEERDFLYEHVANPEEAKVQVPVWILGKLVTVEAFKDPVLKNTVWIDVAYFNS